MQNPPGPLPQLNIHVDFNNLRGKLGSAVDRCVRLVSIGFESLHHPMSEDLRMPGTGWSISFSGAKKWSESEAQDNYGAWLFANGLRDALEAFGAFLDECHDITSCIRLIRKNKNEGQLVTQDVIDRDEAIRTFRRLGIDKKLKKLKPWVDGLPGELQESVRSINRARNILAHHEGLVPESYLEDGSFRISWWRAILIAMGAEEREVVLGETLREGEGLGIRAVSEHRDFKTGDRLFLEPAEFSGVCWSIFSAGEAIREALEHEWRTL
jgi:hypothetical protein